MNEILAINDMTVQALAWQSGVLTVVSENDPLLRRFGQCDLIKLSAGETLEIQRRRADEVWALIAGKVSLRLEDRREDSPSLGEHQMLILTGEQPKTALVPFGVHGMFSANSDAVLLRLTTHEDTADPEDLTP